MSRIRFILLCILAWVSAFGVSAQSQSDTLFGRQLQSELQRLVKSGSPQQTIRFVDSVSYNFSRFLEKFPRFAAIIYSEAAQAAYELEDFDLSASYDVRGLSMLEKMPSPDSVYISEVLLNLIVNKIRSGDYEAAERFTRKSFSYLTDQISDSKHLGNLYHKYGTVKYHQAKYDSCLYYYEKVAEYYSEAEGDLSYQWLLLYQGFSSCYRSLEKFSRALYFDSLAMEVCAVSESIRLSKRADTYNRFGISLEELGRLTEAKEYYYKALDLIRGDSVEQLLRSSVLLNLAYVNYKQGDFGNAIAYFEEVIDLRTARLGPIHPTVLAAKSMLGLCYFNLSSYDKAEEYLISALEGMKASYSESHTEVGDMYIRLAALYTDQAQYHTADSLLVLAEEIFKQNYGADNSFLIQVYNNKAQLNKDAKAYMSALAFQEKAIELEKRFLERGNPRITESYTRLAAINRELGRLDDAEQAIQYAFENLDYDYNNSDIRLIVHPDALLASLCEKTKNAWAAKADEKYNYIGDSFIEDGSRALELFSHLRSQIGDYDSQLKLRNDVQEIFELLLQNYLDQYEAHRDEGVLASAFQLIESSKNFDLLLDYSLQKKAVPSSIPDSVLRQEQLLNEKIGMLKLDKLNKKGRQTTAINKRLIGLYTKKDSLLKRLATIYPAYYGNRNLVQQLSVGEVQDLLDQDQYMINYFFGGQYIYGIGISTDSTCFYRLVSAGEAKHNIDLMVEGLSDSALASSSIDEFEVSCKNLGNSAYWLYDRMIKPFLNTESPGTESRLVIVPDGKLNLIPFEALVKLPYADYTEIKDWPFLIKNYVITYLHSASFLDREYGNKDSKNEVLAFAPAYRAGDSISRDSRQPLTPLNFNIPEVQAIAATVKTRLFTGNKATRTEFVRFAPEYNIIHLAAHGSSDNEEGELSYIAFSNQDTSGIYRLYAGELYQMEIPADLVVLSACETASGQYKDSEGILSVGRGFSMAGAKSSVTSLWSIDDRTSVQMFEPFYEYVKSGASPDIALRKAKLAYIEQADSYLAAHPYYWSPYVFYGNTGTVKIGTQAPLGLYLGGLLGVLIIAGLIFLKKNKEKRNA